MNNPTVSIVMPVYNGEEYIGLAIESIINQTYQDWELVIVNDGSTDKTEDVVRSFEDKRIKLLTNSTNKFISYSLNRGVEFSGSKYVARMDCDDIAKPDRIQKQVDFLEEKPEYGLVGTRWVNFGYKTGKVQLPVEDDDIKRELLHNCCILHPSIMLRRSLINAHGLTYSLEMKKTEDYELYSRLVQHTKIYNIPEYLMEYRQVAENDDRLNDKEEKRRDTIVRRQFFSLINTEVDERGLDLYKEFYYQNYSFCKGDIDKLEALLLSMIKGVQETNYVDYIKFKAEISSRWYAFLKFLISGKHKKRRELLSKQLTKKLSVVEKIKLSILS